MGHHDWGSDGIIVSYYKVASCCSVDNEWEVGNNGNTGNGSDVGWQPRCQREVKWSLLPFDIPNGENHIP